MKKKLIVALALIAFAALLASKQIRSDGKLPEVQVVEAENGKITDSILASGNLVFNTQVQLRSEVTGRVDKVYVEEGQSVAQGDLLMRLDTKAFEAEVTRIKALVRASEIAIVQAKTRLKNAERQLARQKDLMDAGLGQQEIYDNLLSARDLAKIDVSAQREAVNQATASLSIAEDRLSKSVFRAPMSGLLASVNIKEGETVIAGTTNIVGSDLMLVADPSAILAELRVDETDIASIRLDQVADIYAAAYPDTPFKGKVIHIGTSAKAQAGSQGLSFKVKVLLEPDTRRLYAGMSCRAEIATQQGQDTIKLPIEAIVQQDDSNFVWRVDDSNHVSKVEVKLGLASDLEQAVLSGLKEGDRVVQGPARALSKLKEGDEIAAKAQDNA